MNTASQVRRMLARLKRHLLARLYPPVAFFSPRLYREGNRLSGRAARLPLLHFLLASSRHQRRHAYALFDHDFVEEQLQARGAQKPWDTLRAYLKDRTLWTLRPHPLFDPEYYRSQLAEPLDRAPLFDYYLRGNEAPDPHPLFSQQWYLGRCENVRDALGFAGATALTHFLVEGHRRGELPNPYFHTIWYANTYLDGDRISFNPLLHYMDQGYRSGNDPSPLFDAAAYAAANPVGDSMTPLEHYLRQAPLVFPYPRNRLADMFWPAIGRDAGSASGAHPSPPARELMILFTPRSGSTWLSGLIRRTGRLGHPAEWFNFRHVGHNCRAMRYYPEDTSDYIERIKATQQGPNGVFSAEIGADHLECLQESVKMEEHFGNARYVLLYREDILAQAVSLFLATQSGFFDEAQAGNRKHLPAYSGGDIDRCLARIVEQERQLVRYCSRHNIEPLRIRYEELRDDPQAVVGAIARHCCVEIPDALMSEIEVGQRGKIASDLNAEYVQRFRAGHGRRLERLLGRRAIRV